jgi:hypothetical protein
MTAPTVDRRRLSTAVKVWEQVQAEALAAVGLRGQDARRAMKAERRRLDRERFRAIASRVPPPALDPVELARAQVWPDHTKRYTNP